MSLQKPKKLHFGVYFHTAGTSVHGFPGYSIQSAIPTIIEILEEKTDRKYRPCHRDLEEARNRA